MTIACFIPTISVGSTLTHVRFITWTTQYTCWLVVRSCVYAMVLNTKFLGFMTGDYESCEKYCSQFRAPSFWRRCRGLFEFSASFWSGNISAKFLIRQQHQVVAAVAGDCSSLDNWRFILLLRLGNFTLCLSFLLFENFSKIQKKYFYFVLLSF